MGVGVQVPPPTPVIQQKYPLTFSVHLLMGERPVDRMPGSSVNGRSARSMRPSSRRPLQVALPLGPRVEAAPGIGHAPWHASGLLQRDMLAAVSPIREFAKVVNVECALPGRLVAHAAGRGGLGFRLRAFDLCESI